MNVPLGRDTGQRSGDESGRAWLAMAEDGLKGHIATRQSRLARAASAGRIHVNT